MCRHKYSARWNSNATACPNLWSDEYEGKNPVRVKYAHTAVKYDSLPDLYNQWYQDYLGVDFPRVFVRFEDLMFFGKEVTTKLCKCGGGVPRSDHDTFYHVGASAKMGTAAHGSEKTNLLQALIRYGYDNDKTKGMTQSDLDYAKEWFDPKLLEMFNYEHPKSVYTGK